MLSATSRLRPLVLAVAGALALALLAGCGSEQAPPVPTGEPAAATPTSPPRATPTPPSAAPTSTLAPPEPTALAPIPPVARPPRDLYCGQAAVEARIGDQTRRAVALTFDAGADRGYTTEILNTLAQQGVTAAFGLTGVWAEANPDLVSAIAADGHLIINHSYDHPSFTGLSTGMAPLIRDERIDQLQHADAVILSITGATTRPFFRPPFGDLDQSVLCDIYAAGYTYAIIWTIDSGGWAGAGAAEIAQTVISRARPGAIVIMHVGSESQDAAALPEVIAGLRAAGYELVALPELLP